MNNSFSGDFNETQTAGGSGGAASEHKAEGIAPVFIKQLMESGDTNFSMFGMHFNMVCLTAIVRSITTSSTKITYLLEDHTGRIEGHYWLEDGDDEKKLTPDIMLNSYATVYGSVRSQSELKTLMIFRLLAVKDPNAVCTHALEVLNARFKAEDFFKKSDENFGCIDDGGNIGGVSGSSQNIGSGLDMKHRTVFDTIRDKSPVEGISRDTLQKIYRHIQPKELSSILDFLISEGHIYSSVDSDHFLVTE